MVLFNNSLIQKQTFSLLFHAGMRNENQIISVNTIYGVTGFHSIHNFEPKIRSFNSYFPIKNCASALSRLATRGPSCEVIKCLKSSAQLLQHHNPNDTAGRSTDRPKQGSGHSRINCIHHCSNAPIHFLRIFILGRGPSSFTTIRSRCKKGRSCCSVHSSCTALLLQRHCK